MSDFGDLYCPACLGRCLDIAVKAWARLYPDGTSTLDSEDQSHTWDDQSAVQCVECGWSGRVGELGPEASGPHGSDDEVDQKFCSRCGVLRALHENGCPVVEGELPAEEG